MCLASVHERHWPHPHPTPTPPHRPYVTQVYANVAHSSKPCLTQGHTNVISPSPPHPLNFSTNTVAQNKISKFDTLYRARYQPHASRNYSVLSLFNKFLLPCSRQNNMLTVWRELASWVLLETRPLRSYKTVRSTQYVGSIVDQYIQHLNKGQR